MDEATADVFQQTKAEERILLAKAWASGNFDFYKEFAEDRHLLPAAVIVAALDEVSHPLVTESRGPFWAAAKILIYELRRGALSTQSVDNGAVVHTSTPQPVEV
jgi:hypothetical protein